jgi:hypothetical protein
MIGRAPLLTVVSGTFVLVTVNVGLREEHVVEP